MKNIQTAIIIYLLGIFFANTVDAQQQNPIKEYPGIPIITYQGLDYQYLRSTLFDTMKQSGVRAVVSPNLTKTDYDRYIKNSNLLVMPEQQSERVKRYIYKYTEAIYSEWEAEGTPEEDGKVTLYSDSIACIRENGLVRTLPTTPNGTLIYGPMYSQQVHYAFVDIGDTIKYKADFYLMIEQTNPSNNLRAEDTVCVIQVTTTKTYQGIWGWYDEHIIAESAIRYGDFEMTGELQRFTLNYNLSGVPNGYSSNENIKKPLSIKGIETQRTGVGCIQFKVKWKGNSQILRLSVDKIIVSDERGRDLFFRPAITDSIKSQIDDNRIDFGSERIAGWIGLDEPWNLDFWAPIKKVQEILETKGGQLYFQFNVGWNGRFGDYRDLVKTMIEKKK